MNSRLPQRAFALALLLAVGLALTVVSAARADSPVRATAPQLPVYQQECAACHTAYPAGMLPAASWTRLMGGLKKHYGTDATLEEPSLTEVTGWLVRNAGTYKRVNEEPPQDRITKSAWFLRKHRDGEVPADVWKRAAVGSPANCAACHTRALQGSFGERDIKIPK